MGTGCECCLPTQDERCLLCWRAHLCSHSSAGIPLYWMRIMWALCLFWQSDCSLVFAGTASGDLGHGLDGDGRLRSCVCAWFAAISRYSLCYVPYVKMSNILQDLLYICSNLQYLATLVRGKVTKTKELQGNSQSWKGNEGPFTYWRHFEQQWSWRFCRWELRMFVSLHRLLCSTWKFYHIFV